MKKIAVVALCLLVFSCSKKDLLTTNETQNIKRFNKEFSIFNDNNDHDSIRYYHNELLTYFIDQNATPSTPDTQLVLLTDDYFEDNSIFDHNDSLLLRSDYNYWVNNLPEYYTVSVTEDSFDVWENNGFMTENLRIYYDKMIDMLSEFDSTSSTGYEYMIDSLIALENIVVELSETEERIDNYLMLSAIAKFSTYYWFDQLYNEGNWNLDDGSFWRLPRWVATDIISAGFAISSGACLWGLLAGPYGPLAVVAGTAAVGSALIAWF
jgi:hypothetical protein